MRDTRPAYALSELMFGLQDNGAGIVVTDTDMIAPTDL